MVLGYARTSTVEQKYSLEAQVEELGEAGCERVFSEQVSAVGERLEFDKMIAYAREGDCITVTKMDSAFRSLAHMAAVIEQLKEKSVPLKILNLSLDTSTATGKMLLSMLAAVAEFERDMMKERQVEGIARAKAEGRYKGRKPSVDSETILQLSTIGHNPTEIARIVGVDRSTVYRHLEKVGKVAKES